MTTVAPSGQQSPIENSTQLAIEIEEVRTALAALSESEGNQTVITEFAEAIDQLEPLDKDLRTELKRQSRISAIRSESNQDLGTENQAKEQFDCLIEELRRYWEETPKTIRQQNKYDRFVTATTEYTSILESNNSGAWEEWREKKKQSFAVTEIELHAIENVPQYAATATRYVADKIVFDQLTGTFPEDENVIERTASLANNLLTIKNSFQFDQLPDYISAFFNQLSANGSVTLDQVSDQVLEWLRENEALQYLSVQRTTRTP